MPSRNLLIKTTIRKVYCVIKGREKFGHRQNRDLKRERERERQRQRQGVVNGIMRWKYKGK